MTDCRDWCFAYLLNVNTQVCYYFALKTYSTFHLRKVAFMIFVCGLLSLHLLNKTVYKLLYSYIVIFYFLSIPKRFGSENYRTFISRVEEWNELFLLNILQMFFLYVKNVGVFNRNSKNFSLFNQNFKNWSARSPDLTPLVF